MDIINLLITIVLFSNALLGFFIYKNNNKSLVNRSYIFIIITIIFWGMGMIFYRAASQDDVLLWCKLLYVFATFTTPTFVYFSFIFPEGKLPSKTEVILMCVLFALINYLILFSDTVISDAKTFEKGENVIYFGELFYLYVVYFFSHFFYAFAKLFFKIRKYSGIQKVQVKYVFLGYFIATNLAFVTNLTLPWMGIFIFNWAGQVLTIIMVGFTTYAIVKYRLMNIRLVISRSILYTILVGTVASFFALSALLAGNVLGVSTYSGKIISYVLSSTIIVVFIDPIKRTLAKVTDGIFYKDKVDYQQLLRQASNIIAKEIDLHVLLQKLSDLLCLELKLKNAYIFIVENKVTDLVAQSGKDVRNIDFNLLTLDYFETNRELLVNEELIKKTSDQPDQSEQSKLRAITANLEENKIELVVPIAEKDHLTALFAFGSKLSGDIYNNEDIDFFTVLAPQIGTAIEKSKLYEEVQAFNLELKAKVEEKTAGLRQANLDLEARNKFLTTMQAIISMISRTLELGKVNQMIADAISTHLGYIGGILSFIDEEYKVIRVGALTKNQITEPAIAMLAQDVHNFESQLREDFNMGAKTALTGRITFSADLKDFFTPPVDARTIDKIQEYLKVKTVVSVPIFSEDKIIGLIHYFMAVNREEISALDIEMMTALASQVGIVSSKLKLYDNLQKVNKELHEANIHLKALDKAKSEFLSIASHQLRTPISAVKGYLSMILEGDFGKVPEPIVKVIKDVFESAARLARVINVFLNVSRIEAGRLKIEKQPTQIVDMINSVIKELINSAKQKGLELTFAEPKPMPPLIYADADKLREVVLNLIDNAIKYTPQGSVKISLEFNDTILTFITQDTGIGIHPFETKNLFRKFVRGDGVAQIHTGGSGLGLFIAQKIIKEHGGDIWVESEGKGQGSTFKFTVPIATAEEIRVFEKSKK